MHPIRVGKDPLQLVLVGTRGDRVELSLEEPAGWPAGTSCWVAGKAYPATVEGTVASWSFPPSDTVGWVLGAPVVVRAGERTYALGVVSMRALPEKYVLS